MLERKVFKSLLSSVFFFFSPFPLSFYADFNEPAFAFVTQNRNTILAFFFFLSFFLSFFFFLFSFFLSFFLSFSLRFNVVEEEKERNNFCLPLGNVATTMRMEERTTHSIASCAVSFGSSQERLLCFFCFHLIEKGSEASQAGSSIVPMSSVGLKQLRGVRAEENDLFFPFLEKSHEICFPLFLFFFLRCFSHVFRIHLFLSLAFFRHLNLLFRKKKKKKRLS